MLADLNNVSDCYVCSMMPISASHPRLTVAKISHEQSACVGERTSIEQNVFSVYNTSHITVHDNGTYSISEPCAVTYPLKYIKSNVTLTPYVTVKPKTIFPLCFFRSGSVPVGSLPLYRCRQTAVPMETCVMQGQKKTRSFDEGGDICPWPNPRNKTRCWSDYVLPSPDGTTTLAGIYWMCGHKVYLNLPPKWVGICAPVRLTDHTYIITQTTHHRRSRRAVVDVKPHDPIWGKDVPDEHKLWSASHKIRLSLFPWIGVGKLLLRMETQEYRIGLFVNSSIKVDEKQNVEISAMRLMLMQNRLVLDLMAAARRRCLCNAE
ncbi:uncharacterized protein LOC121685764 [Alosa sapidissima]|uniref:uncharacterized protein LOC121685764 n=1 Tax=Alosa sapidissima TaxID=34773 RepID=UPI001C0940FA|nr:uncharacterized protein LOC121685764 [Alosa sapidissima]XP_041922455.1 uncharacterized protein LOC121685764 [Alosa sapidissima]